MLFNSYGFIFVYLPITLLLFFKLGSYSSRLAAIWLTGASLLFYGWWNPVYLLLLVGSIIFNYAAGVLLARYYEEGKMGRKDRTLFLAVTANLMLLGYYKYANFFVTSLNDALGSGYSIEQIVLPIGISFFTFTQIAFLVDASRGFVREYDFIHYCLFVTYFPHLIAGPVLHHKEMMPQFAKPQTYTLSYDNLSLGLSLFFFGLFKKLVLADSISGYATPVFDAAARGEVITLFEAWGGAISYTLQLYFDFSGYTDMAIGMSKMFGVDLPINFNSPYKASNIIEFWRRWHMSLSRFLRDYLYIPLGGNRKGKFRRYLNLMVTMLLGGLWHGANWTFVVWGGLHGLYLIVNHAWQGILGRFGYTSSHASLPYRLLCGLLTFTAVVLAWVFFRSESLHAAINMIKGMAGWNGLSVPMAWVEDSKPGLITQWLLANGARPTENNALFAGDAELRMIGVLLVICWLFPNTQQIFSGNEGHLKKYWRWRPGKTWAAITIVVGFSAILSISELSEFIYFQF